MENNLVYLDVNKIFPHPDNPRKDLGDLTELADSIKAKGIMQNLTVVPRSMYASDTYTVIIGHRRHAAAKLAGLSVVPCVITEMSEKDQLATMMLENMQRSDLTVYEQAQGFQLMMDFGENVESIAEKTGFSKTTIRNRLKLTRLDAEIMRKTQERQPTMEQYMKLTEIEDEGAANYCLNFIGTKNFDAEVGKALSRQKEKKQRAEATAIIEKYAEMLEDASYDAIRERKLVSVTTLYIPVTEKDAELMKARQEKYGKLYYGVGYGFTVYRDRCSEDYDEDEERKHKRSAREELERRANRIFDELIDRADEFVTNYKGKATDLPLLTDFLFELTLSGRHGIQGASIPRIADVLGFEKAEGEQSWEESVRERMRIHILDAYDANRCRVLLLYLWESTNQKKPFFFAYRDTKLTHQGENVNGMLGVLSKLGYNVSDEEWAFCDGRHEIYTEEVPL